MERTKKAWFDTETDFGSKNHTDEQYLYFQAGVDYACSRMSKMTDNFYPMEAQIIDGFRVTRKSMRMIEQMIKNSRG
jgi:hypothetical protein